jgi:hypothetical protein
MGGNGTSGRHHDAASEFAAAFCVCAVYYLPPGGHALPVAPWVVDFNRYKWMQGPITTVLDEQIRP